MKNRLQHFFDRRSPRHNQFGLGFGTIYVFASRSGALFVALLATTFIAGVNYGNNLILGLFFYLLSIWLVSAILTFLQLLPLSFELGHIRLAQAQSIAWVEFYISANAKTVRQIELSFYALNNKALDNGENPLYQHLSDSEKAQFIAHRSIVLSEVNKKTTIRLPVITNKRGVVQLPRLHIRSVYPLGVVQAWSYGFFADTGFAYPVPLAFDESLLAISQSKDSDTANFYQVGQEDFEQLDNYKTGESLSRVSWGHLARGAGMLSKHFADPVGQRNAIDYQAMPAGHHEDKLSQMAYALLALKGSNMPVQMRLPSQELAGVGDEFIDECLLMLAKEP